MRWCTGREFKNAVPGNDWSGAAHCDVDTAAAAAERDRWNVDRLDEDRIREMVKEVMKRQEDLREDILQRVAAEHGRSR